MFVRGNIGLRECSRGTRPVQIGKTRFYRCHVFYFVIWHLLGARYKNLHISRLQYFPNCTCLNFVCSCTSVEALRHVSKLVLNFKLTQNSEAIIV